ncbi:lipase family protein [Nocardia acidivorans]|uniref:lipase family protein n=1 Tax=Nocardia acidivorans TaxID=404580 RepID=UPI00082E5F2A|nr:lipase family protein [Nocardia acidivorans]
MPRRLTSADILDPGLCPKETRRGYRIRFRSSGRTTSGSVYLPHRTERAAGLTLLTWAHCFVGLDRQHAPSIRGLPGVERAHLSAWLANGCAVAAADYRGLDGSGINPFPFAEEAAQDVIEICAAARELDAGIGDSVVAAGFCQGADTVIRAAAVAPFADFDLDYRGTIALSPPDYLSYFTAVTQDSDFPADALIFALLAGMRSQDPSFRPQEFLPATGSEFLTAAESLSVPGMRQLLAPYTVGDLGLHNLTRHPRVAAALRHCGEIPEPTKGPLLVGTIVDDPLTPESTIRGTIAQLSAQGAEVLHRSYAGRHLDILSLAADDAIGWARQSANRSDPIGRPL